MVAEMLLNAPGPKMSGMKTIIVSREHLLLKHLLNIIIQSGEISSGTDQSNQWKETY